MSENGDASGLGNAMTLYATLFTKFNQEGDGIWSRFNILVAMNLALFAGFGAIKLSNDTTPDWDVVLYGICVVGLLLSLWSALQIARLWECHDHWRKNLLEIETSFGDLPKPITTYGDTLSKRPFYQLKMQWVLRCIAAVWVLMLIWN